MKLTTGWDSEGRGEVFVRVIAIENRQKGSIPSIAITRTRTK